MNAGIEAMVCEAIQEALRVAQIHSETGEPIGDIDPQTLCQRFLKKKIEQDFIYDSEHTPFWIGAFVEAEPCEGFSTDEIEAQIREVLDELRDLFPGAYIDVDKGDTD